MKKVLKRARKKNDKKLVSLSHSLEHNIKLFQEELFPSDNSLVYRWFHTKGPNQLDCALIFVDQMIDTFMLTKSVIEPLMDANIPSMKSSSLVDYLLEQVISFNEIEKQSDLEKITGGILQGDSLLLVDGCAKGVLVGARGWAMRAIEEPESETVVRGPREGFNESIMSNLSLLRRKLRTDKLRYEFLELGTLTKTHVVISYLNGIASPEILEELRRRLHNINADAILESGYIEEMIKDSPLSPFKTVGHTERPDIVAGNLLEGRIAVFCDGTPFVLTVPYLFQEGFQANEDYYKNYLLASVDRLIRYFAFFLTTSTPAIYMSLITYHQEMIPTPLLLSISAARDGVPFPTIFEVLAMTLVFEVLREGGIRLPTKIGQALSIVGAIILGDAAVTAQLVSAPMIIVIALTGISSFAIPQLLGVVFIIRLVLVILASVLGLYGYLFGVFGLLIQLMSMRSFGIPYMSNMATVKPQDVKDTMVRGPWWLMRLRPKLLGSRNPTRRKESKR